MEGLQKILKESQVESVTKEELTVLFSNYYQQVELWTNQAYSIKIKDVSDVENTHIVAKARDARKKVKTTRLQIEKRRKELKQSSLRRGQLIDKIANELKAAIEPIETYLLEQENYVKIREQKRKEKLKADREKMLTTQFPNMDISAYNLEELSEQDYKLVVELLSKKKQTEIDEENKKKEAEKKRIEEEIRMREANRKLEEEKKILERKIEEDKRKMIEKNMELEEEKKKREEQKRILEKELEEKSEPIQKSLIKEDIKEDEPELKECIVSLNNDDKAELNKFLTQLKQLIFPVVDNKIVEREIEGFKLNIKEHIIAYERLIKEG